MLKYSFMDNEVYGADDINKAFARLSTKGVTLYKDNVNTTAASELNNAFAQYATRGVELYNPTACMVTLVSNGKVRVHPGSAIMGDGSMITVSGEEYISGIPTSGLHYIYFDVNIAENKIDLICSKSPPMGDNYVMLATFESNRVTDKREFAKSKIAPSLPNMYIKKTVSVAVGTSSEGVLLAHIDIGWTGWQYVHARSAWGDEKNYTAFGDTSTSEGVYHNMDPWTGVTLHKSGQYLDILSEKKTSGGINENTIDLILL